VGDKSNHPTRDQSKEDINRLRVHLGMRPLRMGDRRCLRCNSNFESQDLERERMCEMCRVAAKRHL
jgi:hypothetical protein